MSLRLLSVGIVLGALGVPGGVRDAAVGQQDVGGLVRRSADANAALVRGDIDRYLALIEHGRDYTLMAPFGGTPRRGFDTSTENLARMKRFFRSGTLDQEVVATYPSDDLVVLVTIERARAVIDDLPEQDWSLRVTQVYRREGSGWQLPAVRIV